MSCEVAQGRLIDLAYGEIEGADEHAVRAHVQACDACGLAFAGIERGRSIARAMHPGADPPEEVMAAVLVAARAKAQEHARRAASRAPRPAHDAEAPSRAAQAGVPERGWSGWLLRWLASLATGPQVAMATLLLLMIGVGLWGVPRLRGPEPLPHGTAVLTPDTDDEASAAADLEPAERLRLGRDPRTGQLVIADEAQHAPPGPGSSPLREAGPRLGSAERPQAVAQGRASADEGAAADQRLVVPVERSGRRVARTRRTDVDEPQIREAQIPEEIAAYERDFEPGAASGPQPHAAPGPPPAPAGGRALAVSEERTPRAGAGQTWPLARPQAPLAASAPEPVDPAQSETPVATAGALHEHARWLAARGRHAQCATAYAQLMERFPDYEQAGRALLEMAECQRRLGSTALAERTLERARAIASVRQEAERELARLRAESQQGAEAARSP